MSAMKRPSLALLLPLAVAAGQETARVLTETIRDEANAHYKLGREAFDRGDLAKAEPLFIKAAEVAPEFPEPHYALALILQRVGRSQEALARMAAAQALLPPGVAGAAAIAAMASGKTSDAVLADVKKASEQLQTALPVLAASAAATLPASHEVIGKALINIARYMAEGREAIDRMSESEDPQDQHNARIHLRQHLDAETLYRLLTQQPTDANLWWQLALSAFNLRREYTTASVALAVTASLSTAPMVLMSFYLLFHAWQHLCDWREWDSRLRMLSARLHASLGDEALSELGPGGLVRWRPIHCL